MTCTSVHGPYLVLKPNNSQRCHPCTIGTLSVQSHRGELFAFVDQTEEKGYFQCIFALTSRRFLPFSDRTEASSRWNKVVESLLAIWDKTIATCKCNVIWRTHIESGLEPALPILPENVLTSYVSQEQCTGHKRVK